MTHILYTRTVHETTSLADEGNSAYCRSSGEHNIYQPKAFSNNDSIQGFIVCLVNCRTGH